MSVSKLFSSLVAVALGVTMSLLTACSDDEDVARYSVVAPDAEDVGAKTVLVYMAGHNTLGYTGNVQADTAEIMAGRSAIPRDGRLLLFIDTGDKPRLYRIMPDEPRPRLLVEWDKDCSSTSPQTLGEVLELTQRLAPSARYGLVMSSHADGWLPPSNPASSSRRSDYMPKSFGIDDGNGPADRGTQMAVEDLAATLAGAGFHTDYILFDACLMQTVEVDYALRSVTDYVIASPALLPAAGANYVHLLARGLFSDTVSHIAETYVADVGDPDQYFSYYEHGAVMSVVRTAALDSLASVFAAALPTSSLMVQGLPDMTGVTAYQYYGRASDYRPHAYDMAEAIDVIFQKGEALDAVKQALGRAVVYKAATDRFWFGPGDWTFATVHPATYSGLSLFVPRQEYDTNASLCPTGNHNLTFRTTGWYAAAGWAQTGW